MAPHAARALPPVLGTDDCTRAIAAIEPASGIPAQLLGAISRVETGTPDARDGRLKAWPWSVNAEGRGALYATKPEAISAVAALRARGITSIDVGCMQVNLMFHPTAFVTLEDAFDPVNNVRYAAGFLRALHAETGDWTLAAAYYHSRTPDRMLPYQQKVLAQLPGTSLGRAKVVARRDPLQDAWAATMASTAPGMASPGLASPGLARPGLAHTAQQPLSDARPSLREAGARAGTSYVSR